MVSFTPRPLYPRYPLDMKLCGPQNWSGWREENSWHYRDSNSDSSVVQRQSLLPDSFVRNIEHVSNARYVFYTLFLRFSYWSTWAWRTVCMRAYIWLPLQLLKSIIRLSFRSIPVAPRSQVPFVTGRFKCEWDYESVGNCLHRPRKITKKKMKSNNWGHVAPCVCIYMTVVQIASGRAQQ
jgi:hypothetical protein